MDKGNTLLNPLFLQLNRFFLAPQGIAQEQLGVLRYTIVYILAGLLLAVPIVKTDLFYHQFLWPKFTILLIGSMALAGMFLCFLIYEPSLRVLRNKYCYLMGVYIIAVFITTIFAINPALALQGSFARQMGLITYICFFVTFFTVIIGVQDERKHFDLLIKAVFFAGSLVTIYSVGQTIGLFSVSYPKGTVVAIEKQTMRINSTLGHPDFTGNFLLYIVYTIMVMAIINSDRKKRIAAAIISTLSILSILFTGTRGAWVGLLAGGLVLLFLAFLERKHLFALIPQKNILKITTAIITSIVSLLVLLAFTKWGAPVRARLLAFSTEGYTGAGRTTLWQYTLSLFPKYWLTGWGLDSFRYASLPYKTPLIASLTTGFNQEDPHNAYLSSLVSTGLFTTILYLSLIVFALRYFLLAIGAASTKDDKWLGIGLLSSFSAVLVHNFFIFHDLPTGFYYFFFLALSYSWYQVVTKVTVEKINKRTSPKQNPKEVGNRKKLLWALASLPMLAAIGYSLMLLFADYSINNCFAAADRGNYTATLESGKEAVSLPLYQTDYDYMFAGALSKIITVNHNLDAAQISKLALSYAQKSTTRTVRPEANYVFLALIAIKSKDFSIAQKALTKAGQIDPQNPMINLMWGEYFLRTGDLDKALEQLIIARSLRSPKRLQRQLTKGIVAETYKSPDNEYIREQLFTKYPKLRNKFTLKQNSEKEENLKTQE